MPDIPFRIGNIRDIKKQLPQGIYDSLRRTLEGLLICNDLQASSYLSGSCRALFFV